MQFKLIFNYVRIRFYAQFHQHVSNRHSSVSYLNRSELPEVEQLGRLGNAGDVPMQFPARAGLPNASTDLRPVDRTGDPVGKPAAGVVLERVVEINPVHDGAAGAPLCGGVGEYDEEYEGGDDEEHGPQVDVHEEGVAVARAGDSGDWNHHDGDSDKYERPLEELHAVGAAGAAAQPDSAADDGEGEEEAQEVEESD